VSGKPLERIGIFVAGGPAAGINSVIKGVVQAADNHGIRVLGYRHGAKGLYEDDFMHLCREQVENIDFLGGSVLGISRYDLREHPGSSAEIARRLRDSGVEGLVSIGGEGTLRLANELRSEGVPIVHVPKTIDNDIRGVPQTFGFDTAVQEATRLLSTLKLDAEAADTWFVVEIMGRSAGHLAMESGIAAGVTNTQIPEDGAIDLDSLIELIRSRKQAKLDWGVILVAEACTFPGENAIRHGGRYGGVGDTLAERIEARCADEGISLRVRTSHLGYFLRCAAPTGFDREYAARLGLCAVAGLLDSAKHGTMVCVHDDVERFIPIAKTAGEPRRVDTDGARYRAMCLLNRYAAAEQDLRERKTLRGSYPEALAWLGDNLTPETLDLLAARIDDNAPHLIEALLDLRDEHSGDAS